MRKLSLLLLIWSVANPVATKLNAQYLDFRVSEPVVATLNRDGSLRASLPVVPTIPGGLNPPERISIVVSDVFIKGVSQPGIRELTTANLAFASKSHGPSIEIRLQPTTEFSPRVAGEYLVRLEIADFKTKAADGKLPAIQYRDVRLLRTPAKLEAPVTYVATQVVPLVGKATSIFPFLPVREINGATSIPALALLDRSIRVDPDKVTNAKLQASTIPLAASGDGTFQPTVDGVFRLGDVDGKLELNAPELAAPHPVSYKIRTRRSFSFLVLWASVGVVAGLIVRGMLKMRQEIWEARACADNLLEDIDAVSKKYPDQQLRDKLEEYRAQLQQARRNELAAALLAKTTAVNDVVAKAISHYQSRCIAAGQMLQALRPLVPSPWQFPLSMGNHIEVLASRLKPLPDLLASGDADTVEKEIATLLESNADKLDRVSREWHGAICRLIANLSAPISPVPAELRAQIVNEALGFPSLPPTLLRPNATAQEAGAWLVSLSDATTVATYRMQIYRRLIEESLNSTISILAQSGRTRAIALELQSRCGELLKALEAGERDPVNETSSVIEALGSVRMALYGMRRDLPPDVSTRVQTLLDTGQFDQAAAAAVGPIDGLSAAATENASMTFQSGAAPTSDRPSVGLFDLPMVLALQRVAPRQFQSRIRLWAIETTKTIAAIVLYLVAIYIAAADKFIGTDKELLLIAAGAFVWDASFAGGMAKLAALAK